MGNSSRCCNRCGAPCNGQSAEVVDINANPSYQFIGDESDIGVLVQAESLDISSFRASGSRFGRLGSARHGDRRMCYKDGSEYIGQFENGCRHGFGELISPTEQYVGQWRADVHHGDGHMIWPDGRVYRGQLHMGKLHGSGRMEWTSPRGAMVYEGEYVNQLKHGNGRYIWPDGRVYCGTWVRGKRWGTGTFTITNGEQRHGVWKYRRGDGNDVTTDSFSGSPRFLESPTQRELTGASCGGSLASTDLSTSAHSLEEPVDSEANALLRDILKEIGSEDELAMTPDIEVNGRSHNASASSAPKQDRSSLKEEPIASQALNRQNHSAFALSTRARTRQSMAIDEKSDKVLSNGDPMGAEKSQNTINLQVVMPSGKAAQVEVKSEDTIDKIRQHILRTEGVNISSYVMMFKGARLSPGFSIGFYNVRDGDRIDLQADVSFGYS